VAEHFEIVVIGGGAVGCSALYHLALLGHTDTLLLEMDELTSGSTWHAAGNVPTFSTGWGVMKLQHYSTKLYTRLATNPDYPINYHITGSVRLAHTRERRDEFHHVTSMARANGIEYDMLSPSELQSRHDLAETHDLDCALWDPLDGDIDPAQLTQALAYHARQMGAQIRRFTKVTALAQSPSGAWRITTPQGDITAEKIINAGGYRAGEIMALLGQRLPIVSLSHQYLVTEDIPALAARETRLPLLRDPDISYYLRQERHGFILGPYEWQATAMWQDGIPENFAHQLWNDDLARLEPYIADACARVPALATAGIKRVVNGPIPYSPDGNPYIGPAHGLKNFFHANTFSFGIAQAGGAGKAIAEWVLHGAPEWDLWSLDPRRYTGYATATYTEAKAIEVYQNEYASSYPFEERPAGRPARTSPLTPLLAAKGARFGARGGWERPTWFATPADGPDTLTFRRPRTSFAGVGREVEAVRERVGLLDLPGFTKFIVSGPGATAWLDHLLCSRLPSLGRIALTYAVNEAGKILSEFTVTRLAPDRFYLCAAASAEWHDEDLLTAALPPDGSVTLEIVSAKYGTLVLAGPRARDVLAAVTRADLSNTAFPWLTAQHIEIGTSRPLALRVNYVGELGWELHAPMEDLLGLYQTLWTAGLPHGIADFGIYAVDSLRLDKAYRGWKSDIEIGYSPFEAGLDRFVALKKTAFIGRAALLAEHQRGPTQRMVPLILDHPGDADPPALASVFHAGTRIGLVTSAGWSHTLNASIALAYIRADLAHEGQALTIDIFGTATAATVAADVPYDPTNARLRG
jgi:dimethylglycine dehydrogenase